MRFATDICIAASRGMHKVVALSISHAGLPCLSGQVDLCQATPAALGQRACAAKCIRRTHLTWGPECVTQL